MTVAKDATPKGLHHVEIYVADLERSKQFWTWFLSKLGYTSFQSWDRGFSYLQGETYIVFVQTEDKYLHPEYHRCRTGLNHLAFWATSTAQIDNITRELRERSMTILYEDQHPHASGADSYAVFFEDPDRIKVELVTTLA